MFVKKILMAASVGLVFASGAAFAAPGDVVDSTQFQINLKAEVPSSEFYVKADGTWNDAAKTHEMTYSDGKLASFSGNNIAIKSTIGAVKARLDSAAVLSNGTPAQNIPLSVTVGGTALTTAAAGVEVYNATTDQGFERTRAIVVATNTATELAPGAYTGTVAMTFDAIEPAAAP